MIFLSTNDYSVVANHRNSSPECYENGVPNWVESPAGARDVILIAEVVEDELDGEGRGTDASEQR